MFVSSFFSERETKVPTDSGAETKSAHKGEVTANRGKDNVEVASTLPKNNASEEKQDKVSENEQIRNLYLAYDKTLKELREMEEGKLPPFNKSYKMMEDDDDDDDERYIPHKVQRATLISMTNVIKDRALYAGRTRLQYERMLHARYENKGKVKIIQTILETTSRFLATVKRIQELLKCYDSPTTGTIQKHSIFQNLCSEAFVESNIMTIII